MKTFPVEQIDALPLLLLFGAITAVIILTVGLLVVNKKISENGRKKVIASSLVGVLAGIAIIGVALTVDAYADNVNKTNLRAAVTESGETLTDEQISQLKEAGVATINEDKTVVFSDEGKTYTLIVNDHSENAKAQAEDDEARKKQILENDF